MDKDLYIDFREIDGYGATYNIISTTRGYGKSYGVKKKVMRKYYRGHKRFGYIFRRQTNLQRLMSQGANIFADYNADFGDSVISTIRGFFIEGVNEKGKKVLNEQIGYNFILKNAKEYKPVSYADVSTIWFDECVIENDSDERYLSNEPNRFQNLCDTVMRNRDDVRVYMTCNAFANYNPYAIKWKLQMPKDDRYIWVSEDHSYLVYFRVPKEFIEARKQTAFGRSVSELDYARFSFGNMFQSGNDVFIIPKPSNCRYLFTVQTGAYPLGVWTNGNYVYVSKHYEKLYPCVLYGNIDNQDIGGELVGTSSRMFRSLLLWARKGIIFYDDYDVKEIMLSLYSKYL